MMSLIEIILPNFFVASHAICVSIVLGVVLIEQVSGLSHLSIWSILIGNQWGGNSVLNCTLNECLIIKLGINVREKLLVFSAGFSLINLLLNLLLPLLYFLLFLNLRKRSDGHVLIINVNVNVG